MSNEDEFYCGRTKLEPTPRPKTILMPLTKAKELHVPCGTKDNPHECVSGRHFGGELARCRKCNSVLNATRRTGNIMITWTDE